MPKSTNKKKKTAKKAVSKKVKRKATVQKSAVPTPVTKKQPVQTKSIKTQKVKKSRASLTLKKAEKELQKLSGWSLNSSGTQIHRTFEFPNFITALAFIAKITVHAEILNHHPDIELSYGKVKVKLTTHKIEALSKLDFALAARIDDIRVRF